jgi:hypothetical protein
MTFSDESYLDSLVENIQTDAQAEDCLPPYPPVRKTYAGYRAEGKTPAEAYRLTMSLWRQWQENARPAGYGLRTDRLDNHEEHVSRDRSE